MLLRFILVALLIVMSNLPTQASEPISYEKLSRAELGDLFVQEIERKGIIEQIETHYSPTWQELIPVFGPLVKNYIGCYPKKFYSHTKNRAEEFFLSIVVPKNLELIEKRYLTTGGFQQHQADVKGYFLFDLQEKEAVIGMLNYNGEGFLAPRIEIYVSPTASPETVGKGVEFIRSQITAYMTPRIMKFLEITHIPPFTLTTVTCPE